VFNAYLRSALKSRGLNSQEVALLLAGGTLKVEETAEANFPEFLDRVLESYNHAITRVYVSSLPA
jgi:hypothetical protein